MAKGTYGTPLVAPTQHQNLAWSTWIEINLDALAHNLQQIQEHSNTLILPILKGDAYGHGAPVVAAFLQSLGYEFFGVSSVEEALTILEFTKPTLLLLTPPSLDQLPLILRHRLIPTVTSPDLVEKLGQLAKRQGRHVTVHLKVDTGFGRLGVAPEKALELVKLIEKTPYLTLGGIFTHFSMAFKNYTFTRKQLDILLKLRAQLGKEYSQILWHGANSAAFLNMPASHLDLVRIGTLLYGQSPFPVDQTWTLQDTWLVKTRLLQIRTLPKGHLIGYGGDYKTPRSMEVGVIGAGFAHGLDLEPQGIPWHQLRLALKRMMKGQQPHVLYENRALPVVGRIGMGLSCVDLTLAPELKVGAELVVPMRRTTANAHLPHIYTYKGKVHCIFWNNRIYFDGQWKTNSKGLFLAKSPLRHGSGPALHTLAGQ